MYVFLIILGIFCLPFAVNSPLYIIFATGFIVWGLYLRKKKIKITEIEKRHKNNNGRDSMHTAGDTYIGVYDNDGNFINVRDGNFTQGHGGRWHDNDGHVVYQDDDGEFHM